MLIANKPVLYELAYLGELSLDAPDPLDALNFVKKCREKGGKLPKFGS